jgi:hypothetical protein
MISEALIETEKVKNLAGEKWYVKIKFSSVFDYRLFWRNDATV